jgi:hypothetical protein
MREQGRCLWLHDDRECILAVSTSQSPAFP